MPPEPTAAPSTDTPVSEINVIISDDTCSYEGTLVLKAGEIKVNVDATGEDKKAYGLTFFTLDPGKDIVDLMAMTSITFSVFLVEHADIMGGRSWRKQNLYL